MNGARFAFAQVRLQARYGARASEAVWRQLQAVTDLRAFLEQARATSLRAWVFQIDPNTDAHEIGRLLRAHLVGAVDDVARWLPSAWRPAVRWTATLLDLPLLAYLLRGEPLLDWMRQDETLRPLGEVEAPERATLLARGRFGPMMSRLAPGGSLRAAWFSAWRSMWPERSAVLEALAKLALAHADAFHGVSARAAWSERQRLRVQVEQHFRRAFLEPAAAFAWLLLLALEGERLRAEVQTRALFAPTADSREAA